MKEMKSNISIILPVFGLSNDYIKQLFANSVKSVEVQLVKPDELILVVPKGSDDLTYVKSFNFESLKEIVSIIENDGETDFASQVNLGVKVCKSEWFSILEQDDELAKIWLKNVVEYRTSHPSVGIFLPIVVDVDSEGNFISLTNEAVWANQFSDELGVLDNNSLLNYQNFNIDGMVMKKEIYDEFGGFKSSIKLTFIYEFLLRMTFKDVRVMIIPRFGYKHINQREGSLFSEYKKTLSADEVRWWLAQSKKEYYFQKDRKITYESQNS